MKTSEEPALRWKRIHASVLALTLHVSHSGTYLARYHATSISHLLNCG